MKNLYAKYAAGNCRFVSIRISFCTEFFFLSSLFIYFLFCRQVTTENFWKL